MKNMGVDVDNPKCIYAQYDENGTLVGNQLDLGRECFDKSILLKHKDLHGDLFNPEIVASDGERHKNSKDGSSLFTTGSTVAVCYFVATNCIVFIILIIFHLEF
eukprot:m.192291 g.192291  ORF g.192291 m.192291 type:complete len:104 (+) comp15652_c0_seq12:1070-1381(+)